jgi:hypothetical protein
LAGVRALGWTFAVLSVSLLAGPAAAGAVRPDANCAGLRVTMRDQTAIFSMRVGRLRTARVLCAVARPIARTVANDLLRDRRIPGRIGAFRIRVVEPCGGCAPVWQVTASRAGGSFRFAVFGGG